MCWIIGSDFDENFVFDLFPLVSRLILSSLVSRTQRCSLETPKNQFRQASSSFPGAPIVTTEIIHSNFTLNIIIKHLFNQKMWQSTRKGSKFSPRLPPHNQYTNNFPHMHWNSPHPKPNECEKWKLCVVCSSKRIKNSMKCKPQSVMRVKFAVCSQMI